MQSPTVPTGQVPAQVQMPALVQVPAEVPAELPAEVLSEAPAGLAPAAAVPAPAAARRGPRWRLPRRRPRTATTADVLAVLDVSADAVVAVAADGTVRFVNAAGAVLFGAPPALVVGRHADEFVPDLAAAVLETRRRVLARVVTDPTGDGLDLVAAGADGTPVPVVAWFTPLPGAGRDVLVAVTLRDRRPQDEVDDLCLRLDAEAARARAVVGAVLKAVTDRVVVLADSDGYVTRVNRATEKLLGYRADELLGRPTTRLSDPDDLAEVARELGVPAGVDPILELARWGLPNRQDWDFVTKDGQRRPVSLAVTAIGDRDAPLGFVCVASDRSVEWQQVQPRANPGDRLLLDLDDAATRVLRWGVGRSGSRTGA